MQNSERPLKNKKHMSGRTLLMNASAPAGGHSHAEWRPALRGDLGQACRYSQFREARAFWLASSQAGAASNAQVGLSEPELAQIF